MPVAVRVLARVISQVGRQKCAPDFLVLTRSLFLNDYFFR